MNRFGSEREILGRGAAGRCKGELCLKVDVAGELEKMLEDCGIGRGEE